MVWFPRLRDSLPAGFVAGAAAVAVVGAVAATHVLLSDVAALGLLLLLAAGVARAAVHAHHDADRSAQRAEQALAREREAKLLGEAASSLLAAEPGATLGVAPRLSEALSEAGARLELCHAPCARPGETALPLRTSGGAGWLYVDREGPWGRRDTERVVRALSDLISLAQERSSTARTAAEAEATRRADHERTTLLHAISHDLQRPLTAISSAAGALREPAPSADQHRRLVAVIASESARLERMVADLLDLSKIQAGAVDPHPEWCDLGEAIARAADYVRGERGELALKLDLPSDLPLVRADADQLERAFANLLDNAAKFSPSERPIEVRGVRSNGRITIRVLDHGRGIAPAEQARVFEPFVRGRDAQPGSGLGLAISRGLVEANGGRIALQSRGRGEGSSFAVSFPTTEQALVAR